MGKVVGDVPLTMPAGMSLEDVRVSLHLHGSYEGAARGGAQPLRRGRVCGVFGPLHSKCERDGNEHCHSHKTSFLECTGVRTARHTDFSVLRLFLDF